MPDIAGEEISRARGLGQRVASMSPEEMRDFERGFQERRRDTEVRDARVNDVAKQAAPLGYESQKMALDPGPQRVFDLPRGFGWVLERLYAGAWLTRRGWNGKGQYIQLQKPDRHSRMTLPYIYITTAQGERVPWLASQTDLLATDWQEFS